MLIELKLKQCIIDICFLDYLLFAFICNLCTVSTLLSYIIVVLSFHKRFLVIIGFDVALPYNDVSWNFPSELLVYCWNHCILYPTYS